MDTHKPVAFVPSPDVTASIPANLVARVRRATVDADRVVCVENLAPFYELIRHEPAGVAALCLGGNPSPACRHLLRCLAASLPDDVPLLAWADIDYCGLTIQAALRSQVFPRFVPHRIGRGHVGSSRPLSAPPHPRRREEPGAAATPPPPG